jgi:hypothetical protein
VTRGQNRAVWSAAGTNVGKLDDWRVLSSDNNITVLRGHEQHNANSIMLSYVIRAPPRLCVKVCPPSPLSCCWNSRFAGPCAVMLALLSRSLQGTWKRPNDSESV